MLTSRIARVQAHARIASHLSSWWGKFRASHEEAIREAMATGLNADLRYDIGLDDLRPRPSRLNDRQPFELPVSIEMMRRAI